MRHRKAGVKLNRTSSHKDAMFRNMVTSLFKYDRVQTTDVKAKELRRWADRLITLAKRGDLHARRRAMSIVREKDVVHKLFEGATERFGSISGGYTRIIKIGRRPGDAAPISLVELIASESKDKKKKSAKKAKSTQPKKTEQKKLPAAEEKGAPSSVTAGAAPEAMPQKPEAPAAVKPAAQEPAAADTAEAKHAAAETGDVPGKKGAEGAGDKTDGRENT